MSPDLEMRILVEDMDWGRVERIAHATQVEGAVPVHTGRLRFLSLWQPPSLLLGDIHDLLADTANWNAETWDLEAGELPRLVRTFEILFEQIPEQFGVEVMWAGDEATEERMVSREQMLEIVRQGRFGTTVRYRIQAARP